MCYKLINLYVKIIVTKGGNVIKRKRNANAIKGFWEGIAFIL